MALNDAAVVYPNTAHIFTDAAGTAAKPTLTALQSYVTDTSTGITGYTELGHTTLDNVLAWGSDGGDTSVKGSLQNKSLIEIVTSQAVDYFTVNAMQLRDNDVQKLYWGGGDATNADEFRIPDTQTVQNRQVLVVVFDARTGSPFGIHIKLCGIRRDDSIQMPTDDFASMPLRFTPLKATGSPKMTFIADGLGT